MNTLLYANEIKEKERERERAREFFIVKISHHGHERMNSVLPPLCLLIN